MKLNKNTRNEVKEGTRLFNNFGNYVVTSVFETRYGKQITVRDLSDKRYIYAMPLSSFYGLEIDNTDVQAIEIERAFKGDI